MRQLRIGAALAAALLIGCVASFPAHPYYLTKPAATYHDSTADAAFVFFDEKTLYQINALLLVGRMQHVEQAACLHVAKRAAPSATFYVDTMLTAYIVPKSATSEQITFGCDRSQLPIHFHIYPSTDDSDECEPSAFDTGPAWSIYVAELVSCGIGVDSIIAWRAKPVERR